MKCQKINQKIVKKRRDSVEKYTNEAINDWNEYQLKEIRSYLSRKGINKTKAMFNKELDGFSDIINTAELIEYSKLKEQYGSLEFDQLLFTIQFKTSWSLQNLVWLNENNLEFQKVLENSGDVGTFHFPLGLEIMCTFLLVAAMAAHG